MSKKGKKKKKENYRELQELSSRSDERQTNQRGACSEGDIRY